MASGVDGGTVHLVGDASSSSNAGAVLPSTTSGRGRAAVTIAKVLFEDGLVGRGDVALESFLSDLVSQVMDSRDLALLGNGLAIGVRSVCFHGVDPSCPARGAVAAAGPALFAVGVVVERFRVAVEWPRIYLWRGLTGWKALLRAGNSCLWRRGLLTTLLLWWFV